MERAEISRTSVGVGCKNLHEFSTLLEKYDHLDGVVAVTVAVTSCLEVGPNEAAVFLDKFMLNSFRGEKAADFFEVGCPGV